MKFFGAVLCLIIMIAIMVNRDYKYFIVQSGSMEPTLQIGDMVLVKNQPEYEPGEVITFKTDQSKIVTHRINKIENNDNYLTKGDANRVEDFGQTNKNKIIGKVVRIIPKLGLLAGFAQSNFGFLVLFLVPAGTSIIGQAMAMGK